LSRHTSERSFTKAEAFEQLGSLGRVEARGLRFELDRDAERDATFAEQLGDAGDVAVVVELSLAAVDNDEGRLVGQQEHRLERLTHRWAKRRAIEGDTRLEKRLRALHRLDRAGVRDLHTRRLLRPGDLGLERRDIAEDQLELERFESRDGIGLTRHRVVDEAPDDEAESVHLANARQHPISEALVAVGARHHAADVRDLDTGVDRLLAGTHRSESIHPAVGDVRDTDGGLRRRKGMRRDRDRTSRQRVEQR
jgi:hypothetical protein